MTSNLALALRKRLPRYNKYAESEAVDYLQAIPLAGGLIHGISRPAQGNSRLESGVVQGATGLAGGITGGALGGITGGLSGVVANQALGVGEDHRGKLIALGAVAGMLLGSSVGTAAGSAAGRFVSKREVMTPADWAQLAQATRNQQQR